MSNADKRLARATEAAHQAAKAFRALAEAAGTLAKMAEQCRESEWWKRGDDPPSFGMAC